MSNHERVLAEGDAQIPSQYIEEALEVVRKALEEKQPLILLTKQKTYMAGSKLDFVSLFIEAITTHFNVLERLAISQYIVSHLMEHKSEPEEEEEEIEK